MIPQSTQTRGTAARNIRIFRLSPKIQNPASRKRMEAKMKPSALVDEVTAAEEEIVITRKGGALAVLGSPDELDRWRETLAIHLDR